MTEAALKTEISAEDRMRVELYDFLAALLAAPPSEDLLKKAAGTEQSREKSGSWTGAE